MNTSDDARPPKPESAPPSLYQQAADKVRTFPQVAGVYLMKDAAGRVIYVGKAKNLRIQNCGPGKANPGSSQYLPFS